MHILALEKRERTGRVEEEGRKCRAQDPVGSDLDHLANPLINVPSLSLSLTLAHTDVLCHIEDLILIMLFALVSLSSAL